MNGDCYELTSLSGPESNKHLLQINITPSQITNVFQPGTGEIANENCSAPIKIRLLQQFEISSAVKMPFSIRVDSISVGANWLRELNRARSLRGSLNAPVTARDDVLLVCRKNRLKAYFFTPKTPSFAALATRNLTTVLAGILIFCCVFGLEPVRAFSSASPASQNPVRQIRPSF
jgi:hypothetical protein